MIVDVALPLKIHSTLHYEIADLDSVSLGSVVEVPLRNKKVHGYVLGFLEKSEFPTKPISDVLQQSPIFDEKDLKFFKWISDYYQYPIGEVIETAIPKLLWKSKKRDTKNKDHSNVFKSIQHELTDEQKIVLETILNATAEKPFLIHGVTGSGKTEIYIQLIEETLKKNQQAIVLVPEIALTPQLLGRFSSRFPDKVAVLHSHLTQKERYHEWQKIYQGTHPIVIGARSAIFAPTKNLGMIVIDEEHETSYKQEDHFRYHARDVAILKAKFSDAKIVLGSATPSVESYFNAQSKKYVYLTLKQRVEQRAMPNIRIIDLKEKEKLTEYAWLSKELLYEIEMNLKNKEQTLLFLNRLGYSNFLYCDDCGETLRCKNCDVALTYYSRPRHLKCHYCDFQLPPPDHCSHCESTKLLPLGLGTEQVEQTLQKLFPEANIGRLDRSIVKSKGELENVLSQVHENNTDILIGTQMIAKGHDFPNVTLVGILLADASLNIPDFRATERTYQILTQVSGRAGRGEKKGRVFLQTYQPTHSLFKNLIENNFSTFYVSEFENRKSFGFPPFSRLAFLKFQHNNPTKIENETHALVVELHRYIEKNQLQKVLQILGPSAAPISKIKNKYRWQCLIKSASVKDLQNVLRYAQQFSQHRKFAFQMAIDVDPIQSL
jgi:primosomal protein N' (replication factor Y)